MQNGMLIEGMSPVTIRNYSAKMLYGVKFLGDIEVGDLKRPRVDAFLAWHERQGVEDSVQKATTFLNCCEKVSLFAFSTACGIIGMGAIQIPWYNLNGKIDHEYCRRTWDHRGVGYARAIASAQPHFRRAE